MVNDETFVQAQLEHLNACIIHYISNWLYKIKFFFVVTSTKLVLCSLPQSGRIEWCVSADSLMQHTSEEMAVWLLV